MVVYKHALRNMMVPLLTIIGIFVAIALTGTVLTETVFTRPGLGKMLVDAIGARDYPLAQGAITVFTMTIIVVNLVVDMLYAVVDPRITLPVDGRIPRWPSRAEAEPVDLAGSRRRRGRRGARRAQYLRRWLPIGIGALLAVAMIVIAAAAPLIAPLSPSAQFSDAVLKGPGAGRAPRAGDRRVRARHPEPDHLGRAYLAAGRPGLGGLRLRHRGAAGHLRRLSGRPGRARDHAGHRHADGLSDAAARADHRHRAGRLAGQRDHGHRRSR